MDRVYTELKKFGKVKANELLAKHTTFKVGGSARFVVIVNETKKLVDLLNFLSDEGIDWFVVGGGSNLLFSDEGFEGVVVKVSAQGGPAYGGQSEVIECEAGVLLCNAMMLTMKEGLQGLEWAAGIPGTIGGAVRGNAGAMGEDVSMGIEKVEVWRDGEVILLSKDECEFAYRDSIFKHNQDVVLRAWFKLSKGDRQEIVAKVNQNLASRNGKFPSYPSAGCFFKNVIIKDQRSKIKDHESLPEKFKQYGKIPAGWFIEQTGLKKKRIGDAQVGPEHCNFIVNLGTAKARDILALVDEVKEAVYNKFGVGLEEEVQIIQ